MSLTVKERELWRTMIEREINDRITALWAAAGLALPEMKGQARAAAAEQLGITRMLARQDEIDLEKEKLDIEATRLERQIFQKVTGEDPDGPSKYRHERDVDQVLEDNSKVALHQLMAQHPVGSQVLALEAEKARAMQSVLLATTTQSIKTLWESLLKMIEVQPSRLEDRAMHLPVDPPTFNSGV
jgi:hypothetical protein